MYDSIHLDHALAYLAGAPASKQELLDCAKYIAEKTGVDLAQARHYAGMTAVRLGLHAREPFDYILDYGPRVAFGDIVQAGRIVYNEHQPVYGVVSSIERHEDAVFVWLNAEFGRELVIGSHIWYVHWSDRIKNQPVSDSLLTKLQKLKAERDTKDHYFVHPSMTTGEAMITLAELSKL